MIKSAGYSLAAPPCSEIPEGSSLPLTPPYSCLPGFHPSSLGSIGRMPAALGDVFSSLSIWAKIPGVLERFLFSGGKTQRFLLPFSFSTVRALWRKLETVQPVSSSLVNYVLIRTSSRSLSSSDSTYIAWSQVIKRIPGRQPSLLIGIMAHDHERTEGLPDEGKEVNICRHLGNGCGLPVVLFSGPAIKI